MTIAKEKNLEERSLEIFLLALTCFKKQTQTDLGLEHYYTCLLNEKGIEGLKFEVIVDAFSQYAAKHQRLI